MKGDLKQLFLGECLFLYFLWKCNERWP